MVGLKFSWSEIFMLNFQTCVRPFLIKLKVRMTADITPKGQ